MRKTLETLLSLPLDAKSQDDLEAITSLKGLKGKNFSVQEAMMIMQVKKALAGDLPSATFIRDMLGEKPADKVEETVDMELTVTVDYGDAK